MASDSTLHDKPRSRRRKDARPGEIVEAGMLEFIEHGFERARLDRIAARAGIAKGTIYLYFPSKEALFIAAVEEHVVKLIDETEQDLSSFDGPTEELITRVLRRAYAKLLKPENQAILRILVAESHRVSGLAEKYHDIAIARGVSILEAIIERGISRHEIRPSAMTEMPHLLIAPVLFVSIHTLIFSEIEEFSTELYFEGHRAMVLRALGLEDV